MDSAGGVKGDRDWWRCSECLKVTTQLEARLRKFNEGMCACGGKLYPFTRLGKSGKKK